MMNEIEITRKYFQTLKDVCNEKGLASAIAHELISTSELITGRLAVGLHYLVFGLDSNGLYSQNSEYTSYDFRRAKESAIRSITNKNLVN